jgi:hypothetical protein
MVEQLRQRRGNERRHARRRGARADALAHVGPALRHRALEAGRLVEEDQHVVDRRVLADRDDRVAQRRDVAQISAV